MSPVSTIGTIIVGILIIFLGYLIGVKKMLFLIAGFNNDSFYGDKDKYAKRMGLTAVILGIIVVSIPLAVLCLGEVTVQVYKYIIGVYVVITIIVANYWRFRY